MSYATYYAYLADEPHWVYVVWNGDECMYVGMTSDWRSRTRVHAKDYLATGRATHIDVWSVAENRADAEQIERDTIRDLDPRDNSQHSPRVQARRESWAEFSEWAEAMRRLYYDRRGNSWALHPEAVDRAVSILREHGYSDLSYWIPEPDHLARLRRDFLADTA